MKVQLTPEQEAFIRQGIERGEYRSPEHAVQEALHRWEEHRGVLAEIRAAVNEAEADIDAGRYTEYTDDTLPRLAEELKRNARQRHVSL